MLYSPNLTGIPPSALRKLVDHGAVFVDVRTCREFAGYHIEGSFNLPYDEIGRMKNFIKNLNKPVITYSSHGRRSGIAAQRLTAMGIEAYNAGTIHQIELAMNVESEYEEFSRTF